METKIDQCIKPCAGSGLKLAQDILGVDENEVVGYRNDTLYRKMPEWTPVHEVPVLVRSAVNPKWEG